jgi:hypothetical protein
MAQRYEIRVKSHLDAFWSEWLGDTHQYNGDTLLVGKSPTRRLSTGFRTG